MATIASRVEQCRLRTGSVSASKTGAEATRRAYCFLLVAIFICSTTMRACVIRTLLVRSNLVRSTRHTYTHTHTNCRSQSPHKLPITPLQAFNLIRFQLKKHAFSSHRRYYRYYRSTHLRLLFIGPLTLHCGIGW